MCLISHLLTPPLSFLLLFLIITFLALPVESQNFGMDNSKYFRKDGLGLGAK